MSFRKETCSAKAVMALAWRVWGLSYQRCSGWYPGDVKKADRAMHLLVHWWGAGRWKQVGA